MRAAKAPPAALILVTLLAAAACAGGEPEPAPSPAEVEAPLKSTPTPTHTPPPTDGAEQPDAPASTVSPSVVEIELPSWAQETPGLALAILDSDVIAQVRFADLDAVIMEDEFGGHTPESVYTFEALQYMKGSGGDRLTVRLSSGPKYILFPDVLAHRTRQEAEELVAWLLSSRRPPDDGGDSVLFARGEGEYAFIRTTHDAAPVSPIIGETWLVENSDSTYGHTFSGGESLPLSELTARIEELERLTRGGHGACLHSAVWYRNRVLERQRGMYRELTLAGYREPDPFPRYDVSIDADQLRLSLSHDWASPVFEIRRPPVTASRFSAYWLEGEHKDLFTINTHADARGYYENVHPNRELPPGEYRVIFGQFHQSLPCTAYESAWRVQDSVELVVTVTEPDGG